MLEHPHPGAPRAAAGHYVRLAVMVVLSFVAMYVLMYAMVDRLENVVSNRNQLYMAALMAAPMALLELALMGAMYPRKRLNAGIMAASALALIACWLLIRGQVLITDRQFLRSMIPHHAGAILMCQRAPIRDAEIARLCQSIIEGQQAEIDQMKALLRDRGD